MSTDRELLKLAAKTCGAKWIDDYWPEDLSGLMLDFGQGTTRWDPLNDDGDAFRVAVKLGIALDFFYSGPLETPEWQFTRARRFESEASVGRPGGIDRYAATRRAIVMAAAEIGSTA